MKNVFLLASSLAISVSMISLAPLSWAQPASTNNGAVNLGATIQGNQEQPKVLYIVPWASASGPGDLDPLARQGNNVFERVFAPVERIELRRQLHYLKQGNRVDADK